MELTRNSELPCQLTTEIYPVDFQLAEQMVREHTQIGFDFTVHLGQSDVSEILSLERIALNVGVDGGLDNSASFKLIDDGPLAIQSDLPVGLWRQLLEEHGIPAMISHHAGTYLCNAVFYWSLYYARKLEKNTHSAFIHIPLMKAQVNDVGTGGRGLDVSSCVEAVSLIIKNLVVA